MIVTAPNTCRRNSELVVAATVFAYACARHYEEPLFFEGTDFAETDIASP